MDLREYKCGSVNICACTGRCMNPDLQVRVHWYDTDSGYRVSIWKEVDNYIHVDIKYISDDEYIVICKDINFGKIKLPSKLTKDIKKEVVLYIKAFIRGYNKAESLR